MGFESQLAHRQEPLAALVPALAVPRFGRQPALRGEWVVARWHRFGQHPTEHRIQAGTAVAPVEFLYADLVWDSDFFKRRMVRLQAVMFGPEVTVAALTAAVQHFVAGLTEAGIEHCYCEVSAQDPCLLYALGRAGWGLAETRLHYYHDALAAVNGPRFPVRAALASEADHLAAISATNRNAYDRFHADPVFGDAQADAFLGEYARAAVRGFCDTVLVPDLPVVDSFLAVSYLADDAQVVGVALGRVVLTAVGPLNRGWHRHLVAETLHHIRDRRGEVVFMTTQAANGAVVHNAEKLGFKLGGTTHIFSVQT